MKPIDDPIQLGLAIRAERARHGVTQEQLAAAAGVNPRFVSEMERGKATAEIGKVMQLLHAIGLRIGVESD
jgi:y4mF family transcriptional regulator